MLRADIMEHVLATYDLGEGVTVSGVGKWTREEENHYTCVLSVDLEPLSESEELEQTYVSFHVRFHEGTDKLEDVYALLGTTGDDIGTPGHDMSYNQIPILD